MPDRVQRAADHASKLRREQNFPFMRAVLKAAAVFKVDWHRIQNELTQRSADVRRERQPLLQPAEPEPQAKQQQQELEFGEPKKEPGGVRDYVLRALRH